MKRHQAQRRILGSRGLSSDWPWSPSSPQAPAAIPMRGQKRRPGTKGPKTFTSGKHLDLPKWVFGTSGLEETTTKPGNFFHKSHSLVLHVSCSPLLCLGCVSLGYRIPSNPQQVPINKGSQHPDTFRSMRVPSEHHTGAPSSGGVLPTSQLCTSTC